MSQYTQLALCVGLAFSTSVAAEEFRQHEAHVHGHVELNIAQDGNELLMEITAPGADVVGFEHQPENEQQQAVLAKALEVLNQPSKVIQLNANAKCSIEHVHVQANLASEEDEEHHDHDATEHEHEHEHEHEEHSHAEHDHQDHDHDEHHHSGHGSFTVEYHYQCESFAELESIDTSWFQHFPNTEHIGVNLLTDSVQTALELSKDNTNIKL